MNRKINDVGFIARIKESDGTPQLLMDHLEETSRLASKFAGKCGLPSLGELIGLAHDIGKYSSSFQNYIKSAEGLLKLGDNDYVNPKNQKGKIDHSTAGAQYLWNHSNKNDLWNFCHQLMALCIASHHSGLMDMLSPTVLPGRDDNDSFNTRMTKSEEKAHTNEASEKLDKHIRDNINKLLSSQAIVEELKQQINRISLLKQSSEINQFMFGLLTRFAFSALIDADRLNSAERTQSLQTNWQILIHPFEKHLKQFAIRTPIDHIRANISESCHKFSSREKGLFQLTVPTGGGKTLASLRFALHHASRHKMDRIIYVVPYTSIIDQNARVTREIFADIETTDNMIVLEHHSNLTPELDNDQNKKLSENWDSPIIFTTSVQLLETLFSAGTRGVRRLHQLANSVIIFDEIQTIPIRTVHLFNNAINFLIAQCSSTVVLCTATQPLLDKVNQQKGCLIMSNDSQIMPNVDLLFKELFRAKIEDKCKTDGWSLEEIAKLAKNQLENTKSVLIIVNKKSQARDLFTLLNDTTENVYHLSTSMCPSHRMKVLKDIKDCLNIEKPTPILCISTALIEAGVDVDFGTVIRFLTGLDSIVQAAGRCNRNSLRPTGSVFIVNAKDEKLDKLPEIRLAQEVTARILHEYKVNPADFNYDLQCPVAISQYFKYYFFQRENEMTYPISEKEFDRKDNLLSLLSLNSPSVQVYKHARNKAPSLLLRQSFMSAAKEFKVIDSPTEGVIVPYDEDGKKMIAEMLSTSVFENKFSLMKRAQQFSVNLFPYELQKLKESRRLIEVWDNTGIYYLDERNYDGKFGVSLSDVTGMKSYII